MLRAMKGEVQCEMVVFMLFSQTFSMLQEVLAEALQQENGSALDGLSHMITEVLLLSQRRGLGEHFGDLVRSSNS